MWGIKSLYENLTLTLSLSYYKYLCDVEELNVTSYKYYQPKVLTHPLF